MTYDCALRSHTHICTRRRNVVMIAGYYTSVKQRTGAVQMILRWHNTKSPDMHYTGVREVRSYFVTGLHCSYRTKHFFFRCLNAQSGDRFQGLANAGTYWRIGQNRRHISRQNSSRGRGRFPNQTIRHRQRGQGPPKPLYIGGATVALTHCASGRPPSSSICPTSYDPSLCDAIVAST